MGAIALLEADVQNAVLLGRRIGFSRRLEWCGGDNNGMRRGALRSGFPKLEAVADHYRGSGKLPQALGQPYARRQD